jgi:hypothetical protein
VENFGPRPVRILPSTSQFGWEVHVSVSAAHRRKVSGPQMFRNPRKYTRLFKGHFQKRHLQVRVLSPQPASAVSVGCFHGARRHAPGQKDRPESASLCRRNVHSNRRYGAYSATSLWPLFSISKFGRPRLGSTILRLIMKGAFCNRFSCSLHQTTNPGSGV